ncbi:TPA: transcriptional regulator [Patescibacteria group bacterium]|uniref:Helix-turn-helix domain protein n=1 Tax=Candidatus Gottesmanbacteria bacterium GW2011_GWA1_43_11 TaxID=1618436 RepID=A0A0G1ESK8_9BACT|nr:MAG: Helix-turn-helix domain protein [Candidatus Gottesmanbacteria bacterium GW2011_GWA1_43_11]HCS78131.1 transcriptional regulator [Patescibacteria group bacterium]
MHITDWEAHKKKMLKNPKIRQALKENELEYQIAKALIEARIKKGLTQADVAKKMNTRQSVISRVENAQTTPSLSFLKRLAEVFETSLQVQFK